MVQTIYLSDNHSLTPHYFGSGVITKTKMNEQRKEAIKAFCRFIDNYKGKMTIRNGQIFNSNNELIYQLKL